MTLKASQTFTVSINDGLNIIEVRAGHGERLLDVLRLSGKPVHSPCGGKGTCKKCAVFVQGQGSILACQFYIDSDLYVTLPEARQFTILHKEFIGSRQFVKDSGIMVEQSADKGEVRYNGQTLFTAPLVSQNKYGVALDVGTTTVVLFLQDLNSYQVLDVASFVNPQTAYGSDVISRITHCIEKQDGLATLQRIFVARLNDAINDLCQKNNILKEQIYKSAVVGNTVMLHILCGVNPRTITFAPYTPVFVDEKIKRAQELGLETHPDGIVKILPSIAGYVGADIVAGVASTDILVQKSYSLYIDVGTNGEIVLGNKDHIYCCATAAGPAFEGATIECGVGGIEGAISEFEDDDFATIGDKPAIGICGSGLIDIVAALLDNGLIDATGYMENDFKLVPQQHTQFGRDIVLTPQDVRQVQLAKAAIYAGIKTLLHVAHITLDQVKRLYMAGGFGNYVRPSSAVRIGLIPRELKDRIIPVGNSAGTGARLALESVTFEKEIHEMRQRTEYIELSMREDFNEHYVAAMTFE